MMREDRSEPTLSTAERQFVERLDAAYRPAPLSSARRAALDARVRERLPRQRWRFAFAPALATASLAAVLVWVGLPWVGTDSNLEPDIAQLDPISAAAWESRLFFESVSEPALEEGESGMALPPEYAAIESVFFDG